jgi:YtxH-like protein
MEVRPTIFRDFGGVNKSGIISAIEEENRFYKTAKTFIMNKILLGLLAGVAIGLIVAPDKGSETLRKFREGFDDAKDKASDAAEDLWQKGSKAFRNAKSKFDEAV